MNTFRSLRCLFTLLVITYFIDLVTSMEDAGIMQNEDKTYVIKFHSNPDAYLGWEVREDSTIWFDLDCMTLGVEQYCGFGLTKPGQPAGKAKNMHNADIYTAHGHTVDDRFGDTTSTKPPLDTHSDIMCDHCGLQDGNIHATFYRNLSTGDAQDVAVTNRTFRVLWAIGPLEGDDIGYHNFSPRADKEYMYINFLDPNATVVPKFKELPKSEAARTIETVVAAALFGAVLALALR